MKFYKVFLAYCLSLILAPAALAQTQGNLGATSTGQIDLDLQVTDSVEINRLANIDFGSYGGTSTGDLGSSEAFCVYVNGGDDYAITPTSSNGAAADDSDKFHLLGDSDGDEPAPWYAAGAPPPFEPDAGADQSPASLFEALLDPQAAGSEACGAQGGGNKASRRRPTTTPSQTY